VIPKQLRDELGLRPGEVEVTAYGAALHVEAIAGDESLEEDGGRPVIPATGIKIDDNLVRSLRDAGRK
jgi:bifunctional DNA-binding transcriptional regulator/antitoxin component of YhaV-PrlF toxin-antitoxin module